MSSFIPLDCLVMRTHFSQNAESNLIHWEITLRLQAIYQKLGKRPSGTQDIGRFILCCNQGKKILVIEIVKSYLNYVFNFYIFVFLCSNIIKSCVNATGEDCVVFTGSGTTSAIHKLIHALELEQRRDEKNVRTKHVKYF